MVARIIKEKDAQYEQSSGFIKVLKAQDGIITKFNERLWGSMVNFVTVGRNKEMAMIFRARTEIKA